MDKVFVITKNGHPISLQYTTADVIGFYKLHHNMSLTTYEVEYTPDMRENGLLNVTSNMLPHADSYVASCLVHTQTSWVAVTKTYTKALAFISQNGGDLSIKSIVVYTS